MTFVTFLSDLLDVILFADDTNLFCCCFFSHNDPAYWFYTINHESDRLSDWFKCNQLSPNIRKSKFLLFRPRQKQVDQDVSIKINNCSIEQTREILLVGVVLDDILHGNHTSSILGVKFLRLEVYYIRQPFSFLNSHYAHCIIL